MAQEKYIVDSVDVDGCFYADVVIATSPEQAARMVVRTRHTRVQSAQRLIALIAYLAQLAASDNKVITESWQQIQISELGHV
jgi:hypothetical protein